MIFSKTTYLLTVFQKTPQGLGRIKFKTASRVYVLDLRWRFCLCVFRDKYCANLSCPVTAYSKSKAI